MDHLDTAGKGALVRGHQRAESGVLIVDDRPENLYAFEAALQSLSVRIVKARSGKEAVRLAYIEDFAVILMDLRMPDMDGIEAARALKQAHRSKDTPIIFITADGTASAERVRAYQLGAVDFLAKPIDLDVLRSKVAAFIDLERKHAEAARRAAEDAALRELKLVADAVPALVWKTRPSGAVSYVNARVAAFLACGLNPEFVDLAAAMHPDDRARWSVAWSRAEETGTELELEVRLCRADGVHRWHLVRATRLLDQLDAIPSWIAVAVDVESQKRAEADRAAALVAERDAKQNAERASKLREELLTVVAHELRTPLSTIVGWTTMLRTNQPKSAEGWLKGVDVIERSARTQVRLIEDLLEMSRLEREKLRLESEMFDLDGVVKEVSEALLPVAAAKGVELGWRLEGGDQACTVFADPHRMRQILVNLVSNAVKFTPASGRVEVVRKRTPAAIVLSVSDTGAGIDPAYLSQVFDRYRQVHAGARSGGLGLGLAIVHELVGLHGGKVEVASAGVGRGATFTVTLPNELMAYTDRARGQSEAPAGAKTAGALPALSGARVLLIDDHEDIRYLAGIVLGEAGATVAHASSALEALERLKDFAPDVIVSDVAMPEHDGYWLLERVRATHPHVPALAFTAFGSADDIARIKLAGFAAHLPKPIRTAEFVATIARVLAASSAKPGSDGATASPPASGKPS